MSSLYPLTVLSVKYYTEDILMPSFWKGVIVNIKNDLIIQYSISNHHHQSSLRVLFLVATFSDNLNAHNYTLHCFCFICNLTWHVSKCYHRSKMSMLYMTITKCVFVSFSQIKMNLHRERFCGACTFTKIPTGRFIDSGRTFGATIAFDMTSKHW